MYTKSTNTLQDYLNKWWLVYWRIYASPGLNELNKDHYKRCISPSYPALYADVPADVPTVKYLYKSHVS